ncbi:MULTISPECIES: DUF805 domain-containing protein [unclassified Streptomyces]|uniref:DUF805 domain-containing protein n=1 Tax=unclassified Streptomyces TaxID=2593676 RepID=UPI00081DED6F|nr:MULTISPECIES: DUF805 domain-containing protein [unclassified Streptomyces]MYZ40788.1 DUF805 domain-containing protein [Streptomyces sp. SID4917]SCG08618.1 Uncharacterized membrane protein YhaH, DUF805 family [Streptomyces sp. MnatMP-M17]
MNWYLGVLKNYAGFSGRARRTEFWMFVLFNILAEIVVAIIDSVIGLNSILIGLYVLAVLIPGIAVSVRRLHDTDKSGWFLLFGFIPLVGGIILIVFCATAGTAGPNKYGYDPKQVAAH